ncbi:uncharacterized protein TNCV_896931 [Trichonephila clavipes]|nr:uncharacterized protein TNCV_896931 [Trichonephila clavipes]
MNALKNGQEETRRFQEETKNELKKGLDNMQRSQEELRDAQEKKIDNIEEKINSVEERIAVKMEEKIAVVEEKIEKKVVCVPASPVPLTASPVTVKLSTYEGKTNWEVYKTQFSIISEANGWSEGVKACQLVASLRGEAAEVLQTLPDTEQLNLNSLYNALDLRFDQKYSKDYACLQMKTRLQKTGESLQEYASKTERIVNLAFSDHPATVREIIY